MPMRGSVCVLSHHCRMSAAVSRCKTQAGLDLIAALAHHFAGLGYFEADGCDFVACRCRAGQGGAQDDCRQSNA